MIANHTLASDSFYFGRSAMPKEKKILKCYRFSPLVVSLIAAERTARTAQPGGESITDGQIIEECILRHAADNPALRIQIINELQKDYKFSALYKSKQLLSSNPIDLAAETIELQALAEVAPKKPRGGKSPGRASSKS